MSLKYCPYCKKKGVSDKTNSINCRYCKKTLKTFVGSYGDGYKKFCNAWKGDEKNMEAKQ